MTIEITIRLNAPEALAFEDVVLGFDVAAEHRGNLAGGFYFRTNRTPADFFEWIAVMGLSITDFESIEFKPA